MIRHSCLHAPPICNLGEVVDIIITILHACSSKTGMNEKECIRNKII
jgi:hypothetical protein